MIENTFPCAVALSFQPFLAVSHTPVGDMALYDPRFSTYAPARGFGHYPPHGFFTSPPVAAMEMQMKMRMQMRPHHPLLATPPAFRPPQATAQPPQPLLPRPPAVIAPAPVAPAVVAPTSLKRPAATAASGELAPKRSRFSGGGRNEDGEGDDRDRELRKLKAKVKSQRTLLLDFKRTRADRKSELEKAQAALATVSGELESSREQVVSLQHELAALGQTAEHEAAGAADAKIRLAAVQRKLNLVFRLVADVATAGADPVPDSYPIPHNLD